MVFLLILYSKGVKDSTNYYIQRPSLSDIVQWSLGSLVIPQGLPVKVVFTMARPNTLQVGDVITQLLDGFHLLMQIVTLNEVSHLEKKQNKGKQVPKVMNHVNDYIPF